MKKELNPSNISNNFIIPNMQYFFLRAILHLSLVYRLQEPFPYPLLNSNELIISTINRFKDISFSVGSFCNIDCENNIFLECYVLPI